MTAGEKAFYLPSVTLKTQSLSLMRGHGLYITSETEVDRPKAGKTQISASNKVTI